MTGDGTPPTEDTIRLLVAEVQQLRDRVGALEQELRGLKEAQLDEAEERERELAAVDDKGRKNTIIFHGRGGPRGQRQKALWVGWGN